VSATVAKPKRRMSKIPFNDKMSPIHLRSEPREEPPTSLLLRPYWLLRILRKVITQGGYISPKVFVPKLVWSQYGVKFTGLSAKTSAFEQLLIAISGRAFLAESISDHSDGLSSLVPEFKFLSKDLIQLQNNLSKPLTYIQEVIATKECQPSPAKTSQVTLHPSPPHSLWPNRWVGCPAWSQPSARMSSNTQRPVSNESVLHFPQEWMMRISFPLPISRLSSVTDVKCVLPASSFIASPCCSILLTPLSYLDPWPLD
jgi:hypothetical protein